MKIDCTTCKYGYEDERLGIPMCHHPKRFSEDCVNFNMHEEKETEESEKPVPNDLEEAASEYSTNEADRVWGKPDPHDYTDHSGCGAAHDNYEVGLQIGFKAGAKWQKEQMMKEAVEGEVRKDGTIGYFEFSNEQQFHSLLEQFQDCDKVRIIIVKED